MDGLKSVRTAQAKYPPGSPKHIKASKLAGSMFDALEDIDKAIAAIESGDELALARMAKQPRGATNGRRRSPQNDKHRRTRSGKDALY
jgi:hypothetical protein